MTTQAPYDIEVWRLKYRLSVAQGRLLQIREERIHHDIKRRSEWRLFLFTSGCIAMAASPFVLLFWLASR